jgi:hypothetical protein
MQSHQNMPCARLIKQAAGLLRTQFIPDDTRWQAARRGSQPVGLDRFLYLYLLYDLTNSAWRILADFYIRSGGFEKNHLATLKEMGFIQNS